MPLTVVAYIEAKEDKIELVKSELMKLLELARKAEGCLQSDMHQDNEASELFLFYEIWESREFWQKHVESSHIKAYMKTTEGSIENFAISEMSRIDFKS